MTLWNRPGYASQVFDALARCEGVGKYLILPFVDPVNGGKPNPKIWDLVNGVNFARCRPHLNETRLGTCGNTRKALSLGFELADFVIHIEEDCVPGRDALAYFEHCQGKYRDDAQVFAIAGWNKSGADEPEYAVGRRRWFTCWGWATWWDCWEEMRKGWSMRELIGWARQINNVVRGARVEIYPMLSRIQNIGEKGLRVPSPQYHMEHQRTEYWAEDLPGGKYYEA